MNSFLNNFKLNSRSTRLILIVVLVAVAYLADRFPGPGPSDSQGAAIEQVIAEQRSGVQVSGSGMVVKMLADDNQGSRHQRFLLRLENGHVILVSHNIDLAPRLNSLREGKRVSFYGEFEWNDKGGVVHWTHHDPNGNHPHGWLEYQGEKYQ